MIQQKKGQIGLDVVKGVMVMLLVLSVLGITSFLVLTSLTDAVGKTNALSGNVYNESGAYLNSTGYTLATTGLDDFVPTIVTVHNASNGVILLAGNYTLTGNVLYNATTTTYSAVNVTYSYTYTTPTQSSAVEGNVTTAIGDFFGNSGTIFAILVVVIIMLAIGVAISVVNRFGRG